MASAYAGLSVDEIEAIMADPDTPENVREAMAAELARRQFHPRHER